MLINASNSPAYQLAKAFIKKASNGLFILTGPRGAGKTIFCVQVADLARQAGLTVGGLVCPAVFIHGEKAGIDQIDLASGECRRLGMRDKQEYLPPGSPLSTTYNKPLGCWRIDERVIQWGNQVCTALDHEDLIIIDELGPLELEEGAGYQQALQLLDAGRYRTALVVVRPELLQAACLRWPHAQAITLPGETA